MRSIFNQSLRMDIPRDQPPVRAEQKPVEARKEPIAKPAKKLKPKSIKEI